MTPDTPKETPDAEQVAADVPEETVAAVEEAAASEEAAVPVEEPAEQSAASPVEATEEPQSTGETAAETAAQGDCKEEAGEEPAATVDAAVEAAGEAPLASEQEPAAPAEMPVVEDAGAEREEQQQEAGDEPAAAEDAPAEEAAAADDDDAEDAKDEDSNPLVMDERKGTAKNKKKKVASNTVAKEKPTSSLDLINARLKELQEKSKEQKEVPAKQAPVAAVNTMDQAMELYKKGGEKAVRDALQKSIQDTKKLEREVMLLKRKNDNLSKEKEKINLDTAELRTTQQRSRLNCLEIQKHIKTLKDVADKLEAEKETQRSELETKLQTAIDDVRSKIKDGQDERDKLVKENEELAAKIEQIEGECESRFEKYRDINDEKSGILTERRKEEEEQERVTTTERQRSQLTEEALRMTMRSCEELAAQIKLYSEKMVEIEKNVEQSKSVFGTFGAELQKMRDFEQASADARDVAKKELAELTKKSVDGAEKRTSLRKQITQQQAATTKSKEQATRLQSKRSEYKPFEGAITAWLESQAPQQEEQAQAADKSAEAKPQDKAKSSNVHQDPNSGPTKNAANHGADKENLPPGVTAE